MPYTKLPQLDGGGRHADGRGAEGVLRVQQDAAAEHRGLPRRRLHGAALGHRAARGAQLQGALRQDQGGGPALRAAAQRGGHAEERERALHRHAVQLAAAGHRHRLGGGQLQVLGLLPGPVRRHQPQQHGVAVALHRGLRRGGLLAGRRVGAHQPALQHLLQRGGSRARPGAHPVRLFCLFLHFSYLGWNAKNLGVNLLVCLP